VNVDGSEGGRGGGLRRLDCASPILVVDGVRKAFRGVVAVDDVSLCVDRGEIVGVLGPNGAGKSTLFKIIAGQLRPDGGSVFFEGNCIDGLGSHERARVGIGLVFQQPRLFDRSTVYENVLAGTYLRGGYGFVGAMLRLPRYWRDERVARKIANDVIERHGLEEMKEVVAGSLPFGMQKRVAVARTVASGSKVLLLDEVAAGLSTWEKREFEVLIKKLPDEGLTLMAIEHDVGFISRLVDRLLVMESGALIAEGEPQRVLRDERVREAYSGFKVSQESRSIPC